MKDNNAFNESSKRKLKTTVGPTDRKRANLEAEKGETVLTNLSEGNNIYELKKIGGKKHSKGGTPLDLPAGENPGEGSSFIFSDNKKLMMKDEDELAFFGIKSKKGLAPAAISEKHVDAIAKSKAIILDKYADKISKATAEKNLDNSRFALSALALWQESKKGMKDGASDQFQTFFDKTQTTPEDMFKVAPEQEQALGKEMSAAFGGQLKTFSKGGSTKDLPKYKDGDDIKFKSYTKDTLPNNAVVKPKGESSYQIGDYVDQGDGTYMKVNYLGTKVRENNTKTVSGNVSEWANQNESNKAKLDLANKAIEDGIANGTVIDLGGGNVRITGKFDPEFRTRVAISDVLNQSGNAFKTDKFDVKKQGFTEGFSGGSGSFVSGFKPIHYEKRYLLEKLKAKGVSEEEAYSKLDEIYDNPEEKQKLRKEFVGFLGINLKDDEDLTSDDFYKSRYKDVTTGIESKLLSKNDYRPAMGDDKLSGFEHFDAFGFDSQPEYEIQAKDATPDVYNKGKEPTRLGENKETVNPWGFRREDINSLNRAVNAKQNLRRYDPWSKAPQVSTPDVMFYSPERAIAATNEQLAQGIQSANTFSTPAQAAAAASQLQGNAYAQVANTIGRYADKNVGVFNQAEARNTQLANAAAAQDAQTQTTMHDKRNALKQNFDNSLSAAKDKITQLSNQAWTNASNIHNLNLNTENFKKDPYTGLISKVGDKEVTPMNAVQQDPAALFAEYKGKLKGVSDDTIAKLVAGRLNGKYDMSDPNSGMTNPNELNRLQ